MAIQEWIAVRKDLYRDPDVLRIAQKLKTRVEHVVGYLHRVWGWLDEQCDDGHVHGITLDTAEEMLTLPHFLHLMCEVGWLEYEEEHITVPNWDRWMGSTAKKRLQDARRKQLTRTDKTRTNVRKSSDVLRTRSSSSSSSSSSSKSKKKRSSPPTVDEVRAYCQQRGNNVDPDHFVDYYSSQNWKKANGQPLVDWKAGVRTFEKTSTGGGQKSGEFTVEELFGDQS